MSTADDNIVPFDDYERNVREPQRRYYHQLEFQEIARLEREIERRKQAMIDCWLPQKYEHEGEIERLGREIDRRRQADALASAVARALHGGVAKEAQQPPAAPDAPLPYVDLALDLVSRSWLVLERIPMLNVTMLGGEGAIGKSLLLMQLSGAVVLGKEWIGTLPEQGPVLYMSCEEDDDEVRRRMEDVARHLGSTRQEMIERGLRILSFAGRDAVLAQPDRAGVMRPTPVFERLRRDAVEMRPKLIVLDTVADIFAGRRSTGRRPGNSSPCCAGSRARPVRPSSWPRIRASKASGPTPACRATPAGTTACGPGCISSPRRATIPRCACSRSRKTITGR
jgi:hypothetical protein